MSTFRTALWTIGPAVILVATGGKIEVALIATVAFLLVLALDVVAYFMSDGAVPLSRSGWFEIICLGAGMYGILDGPHPMRGLLFYGLVYVVLYLGGTYAFMLCRDYTATAKI